MYQNNNTNTSYKNNTTYGYPVNPSIEKINKQLGQQQSSLPKQPFIFGVGDSEKARKPQTCTTNNSGGHSTPCFMRQMY